MHDDEMMDRLLHQVMSSEAPQLSPGFEARLSRSLRQRRLSPAGRAAIASYVAAAAAVATWALADLPIEAILAAATMGTSLAAGVGIYVQRLTTASA